MTIHQAASFAWKKIHHVVLLSHGKIMYQGSRKIMEAFFAASGFRTPSDFNPMDHYVSVVSENSGLSTRSPDEWADMFQEWTLVGGSNMRRFSEISVHSPSTIITRPSLSNHKKQRSSNHILLMSSTDTDTAHAAGAAYDDFDAVYVTTEPTVRVGHQALAFELLYRSLLSLWLDVSNFTGRALGTVALSVLTGATFGSSFQERDVRSVVAVRMRLTLWAFFLPCLIFVAGVTSVPFLTERRAIVAHETRNGRYPPLAHHLAHTCTSTVASGLLACVSTLILVSMTDLRGVPTVLWCNMFLTLLCSDACAALVSHLVSSSSLGMLCLSAIFCLFTLIQGFMIMPSDLSPTVRWVHTLGFPTYSWRNFIGNEFGRQHEEEEDPFRDDDDFRNDDLTVPQYEYVVLKQYGIESGSHHSMRVLLLYAVGLQMFLCLLIGWRHKYNSRNKIIDNTVQ